MVASGSDSTRHKENPREMTHNKKQNTTLGKLVFAATAVAMIYFFWWLLIYDHGVISIH